MSVLAFSSLGYFLLFDFDNSLVLRRRFGSYEPGSKIWNYCIVNATTLSCLKLGWIKIITSFFFTLFFRS